MAVNGEYLRPVMTQALEQYLNPVPIPAYTVQNPNCCGSNWYSNCGCGSVA